MQTLPQATLSPVLWPDEERAQMLRGSPVLQVRCSSRPRGRATSCHCGSSSQMAAPAGLASANKQQSAQAVLTKTPAQCGRLAGGAHPRAGAAAGVAGDRGSHGAGPRRRLSLPSGSVQ